MSGCLLMKRFLKYKCPTIRRTIRKSDCFQEISDPINSFSSEKEAVPKKYLLRKSTCSE